MRSPGGAPATSRSARAATSTSIRRRSRPVHRSEGPDRDLILAASTSRCSSRFSDILRTGLKDIHGRVPGAMTRTATRAGTSACTDQVNSSGASSKRILKYGRPFGSASRRVEARADRGGGAGVERLADRCATASKDGRVHRMAMLTQKVGRTVCRSSRVHASWASSSSTPQKVGVRPTIRDAREAGVAGQRKWQSSGATIEVRPDGVGGAESFHAAEALGMQDCLKLLHFHMRQPDSEHPGSVKAAVNEASAHLRGAGQGRAAKARVLDIGGGLGVGLRRARRPFRIERQLHPRGVTRPTSSTTCRRCATTPG